MSDDPFIDWVESMRAPLYPVTITAARYQGSYEGGTWTAFNCYPHQIPADADGDDIACVTFWTSSAADRCGRGNSPAEALADLVERVKTHGEIFRGRGE